jgi:FkbM family methyltransferase
MRDQVIHAALQARQEARLRLLKRRAHATPRFVEGTIELDGQQIAYRDLLSLYIEYKDIFVRGVYDFTTSNPRPRIIDGGSHIGMSVLRFKQRHPGAQVTCVEPEPESRAVLERNIASNHLQDVTVIPAALAADERERGFVPDGTDGGRVTDEPGAFAVPSTRLSELLAEPADFLKLNIEGFELDVLRESAGALRNVEQLVIEYHGWPDGPQALGPLLSLLDEAGFRYLLNDFDEETNAAVRTPFRLSDSPWFALVYAARVDRR